MSSHRRTVLFAVILLGAAGAALAYFGGMQGPEVVAAKPIRGPAVQAVYATGVVEAETWAKVAPVVAGRIAGLLADEGQEVRQGQALLRLDDREARAHLAELEAKEHYWRAEVGRQELGLSRGFASHEAREKAESEYRQAQYTVAAQQQRISDLTITAPIDGMVLRRDGEVGEAVDKNQVLFWVGQPRPLRITADVDEEDIPLVRPGQRVLVKADAFPGRVLEGAVSSITPKGDSLTKSFRVRIGLPADTPVQLGMTTEVNIITREVPGALLLPSAAVVDGKVWTLDGEGRVHAQAVALGIRGRDRLQVVGGLADDAMVLSNPPSSLSDGQRVRVGKAP